MSERVWDGGGPVLVDTSAWMQARRDPGARELLLGAVQRGDVCWCWPVRYELMIDARGSEGIAAVERMVDGGVPVMLVRGRVSDLVSEEKAASFCARFPAVEFVDVSGAGHMVAGDRNDAFSAAVLDFLGRHQPLG